jgi:uncharacterized protein (TIGR02594 family)
VTPLLAAALRLCNLGIVERPGGQDHPFIVWALELAGMNAAHDEVPWCGAGLCALCDILGVQTPLFPARARSWLTVGAPVELAAAQAGDIVIFARGADPPPAEVLEAPGHVAILEERLDDSLYVVGGNQRDSWCRATFGIASVLGVRRL